MIRQCCINARIVHSLQTNATTTREQAMPEPTNHSYMLRLWRERSEAPWRVPLIAVAQPDERRHFDTLEDCFAYLREQASQGPDVNAVCDTIYCTPLESS